MIVPKDKKMSGIRDVVAMGNCAGGHGGGNCGGGACTCSNCNCKCVNGAEQVDVYGEVQPE